MEKYNKRNYKIGRKNIYGGGFSKETRIDKL